MIFLFDVERGEGGVPKLKPPDPGSPPTGRQLHARRCYLLGVTDPAEVDRLWREAEAARPAAAPGKTTRRKGGRRGAE